MKTWIDEGKTIQCTSLTGKGSSFSVKAGKNGTVTFELADKNSYALYSYSVN